MEIKEALALLLEKTELIEQESRLTHRLISVLIGGGSLHEIGGYVYGITKDGEGDPFIILYPAAQGLKHKVCRVYINDFSKLPSFIPVLFPEGIEYVSDNPTKTDAIKRKIYHRARQFTIATYLGPETHMGPEIRFHSTIYIAGQDGPPPAAFKVPATAAEQPPQEPEPAEEISHPDEAIEAAHEKQIQEEEREKEGEKTAFPEGAWRSGSFDGLPDELKIVVDDIWGSSEDLRMPTIEKTALIYGDNTEVPRNQATYKLYMAYVVVNSAVPEDKERLRAFYKEQEANA